MITLKLLLAIKYCPVLYPPHNGHMSSIRKSTWAQGDYVYFTCVQGYVLDGAEKLTCAYSGSWSGAVPVCKKGNDINQVSLIKIKEIVFCIPYLIYLEIIRCPKPSVPSNGYVISKQNVFAPGDHVYFGCNKGYNLIGLKSKTCSYYGTWSKQSTTCQEGFYIAFIFGT